MKRITHILKHADVFGDWLATQKDTKVVGDAVSCYSNALAYFIVSFGHSGVRIGLKDYQTDAYGTVTLPAWAIRYIVLTVGLLYCLCRLRSSCRYAPLVVRSGAFCLSDFSLRSASSYCSAFASLIGRIKRVAETVIMVRGCRVFSNISEPFACNMGEILI